MIDCRELWVRVAFHYDFDFKRIHRNRAAGSPLIGPEFSSRAGGEYVLPVAAELGHRHIILAIRKHRHQASVVIPEPRGFVDSRREDHAIRRYTQRIDQPF